MRGGLSPSAMCIVGCLLLKSPFCLPRTNLQGDIKFSLSVKDRVKLQASQLGRREGYRRTITHRASLGCFVPFCFLPNSLCQAERMKQWVSAPCKSKPPQPSAAVLKKRGQNNVIGSPCLFPPNRLTTGRHPSLQAALGPMLCLKQECRASYSGSLPSTAVRCADTALCYICSIAHTALPKAELDH